MRGKAELVTGEVKIGESLSVSIGVWGWVGVKTGSICLSSHLCSLGFVLPRKGNSKMLS